MCDTAAARGFVTTIQRRMSMLFPGDSKQDHRDEGGGRGGAAAGDLGGGFIYPGSIYLTFTFLYIYVTLTVYDPDPDRNHVLTLTLTRTLSC